MKLKPGDLVILKYSHELNFLEVVLISHKPRLHIWQESDPLQDKSIRGLVLCCHLLADLVLQHSSEKSVNVSRMTVTLTMNILM